MTRILLVDDQPPHETHFRRLFEDQLDVCRSHEDLVRAVSQGGSWSSAFVDYDLSGTAEEPRRTGLSVLRLLLQERPHTRRVVYTTLSDNGRTLYAVAAWQWLETKIILDKSSSEQALLAAAIPAGPNPTLPAWQQKLKYAYLIDDLFARYNWLSLWQIWRFYDGSIKAVRDHLPYGSTPASVRDFSEHAADAVDAFRSAFQGPKPTSYQRGNSARATPLVAFADANSKFFHAPDLQEVLDFAKPWDRLRTRTQR